MNENKVNGVGSVQFRREDKDRVYEVQAMDSTDRWSKNRKGAQQLDLVYWERRDGQYRLSAREGAKRTDPERTFISLVALPSSIRFRGRREDIGQPELERKQEHQGPVQESASVKEENPTV
ncbi:hypothetical protein SDJN03_18619, partial [Cucurbita argyrosperma subsp. sororia]